MPLDLDFELRLAVFDHVGRLSEAGGGLVAGRALSEGLVFRGQRVPIWSQQKGIFRPALLKDFGAALTIQTSFKSPYDDRLDPSDDYLIYRYRGDDPAHPDNVSLRRVMDLRRPLLYVVAREPGLYRPIFPCYVVRDDPAQLAFWLVVDAQRDIVAASAEDVLLTTPLKAYATRQVKQRLHQERFRYLVLAAYRRQCAMCRLRQTPLLEASHILPDRDVRGAPEIPNGLALCRIHHGAYDVGILGIDPDCRIHLREDVLQEHDGPMLRHGLQEMHGELIQVPRRPEHRPNPDYLAERFARFRAA